MSDSDVSRPQPPPPAAPVPQPEWLRELGWSEVYEIRRVIARGGMGHVYEGWHRALGTRVALKIMDPHLVADDQWRARFEKEAMTLARLQEPTAHPNIVRVLDFKLLDSVGCIVMAFVPGQNLWTWSQEQKLDVTAQVEILSVVARAAGYIHSCGLVHRDLKPANVLVREESGQPVIVDFGIVRGHSDVTLTRTQQSLGTVAYMAPEQLRVGDGEPGPRADVYALGVMLYELLTGRVPHGRTITEVLPRHNAETAPVSPVRLAPVSRDLERICLKALAHRPEERYATGTELAEDLDRYLRGETVLARPVSVLTLKVRQWRKRPLLVGGTVAAMCLTGFLLWQQWQQGKVLTVEQLKREVAETRPLEPDSLEALVAVARRIEDLSARNPELAESLRAQLVSKTVREVLAAFNEPRLSDSGSVPVEPILTWIQAHDAGEGERLRQIWESRQQRWEAVAHLQPPFENAGQVFQSGETRMDGDDLVLEKLTMTSHALNWTRPAPLEVHLKVMLEAEKPVDIGISAGLFRDPYVFSYQEPVSKPVLAYLKKSFPELLPKAALVITRGADIMEATVVPPSQRGLPMAMNVRIERHRLLMQLNDAEMLEHHLRYSTWEPVVLHVVGTEEMKVREIILSAPGQALQPSPLEKGDMLAGRRQWRAAETAFLALMGHPTAGQEAAFKAGECQMEQKRPNDARRSWETVFKGPDSAWRTKACFALWKLETLAGDLDAARHYLDRLPHQPAMPPDYLSELSLEEIRALSEPYRATARGLRVLMPMAELEDAIRAHQLLGYSDMDQANRFALSRHFNGTDRAAGDLFFTALQPGPDPKRLDAKASRRIAMTFEQWFRMSKMESDVRLNSAWRNWNGKLPATFPLRWTLQGEQARLLARQGKTEVAKALAAQVQEAPDIIGLTVSSAALLRAALGESFPGDVEKDPVLRALAQLASRSAETSATALCDQVVLHCVARNWTRENMTNLLGAIFSVSSSGPAQATLQSQLNRFFLEDPTFPKAMNTLLRGKAGEDFLRDYALHLRPSREVVRQLLHMLLCSQVVQSQFGENPQPSEVKAVDDLVKVWLDCFATNELGEADFFRLMMRWNQAAPEAGHPPLSPKLETAISEVLKLRPAVTTEGGS